MTLIETNLGGGLETIHCVGCAYCEEQVIIDMVVR